MSASLNRFLCFGGTPFIYFCFVLAYSKIWLIEGDDCSFQKMSHSCVCLAIHLETKGERINLWGVGGGGSVCGRVPSSGVSIEFFFLSSLWCIIRIDVEMEPTRNICQTGWKHLTDTSDPCGSIPHVNDPPFFYSMAPEENKTKNRKKKKEQSGIPFYLFNEIKWKSECFASVASMFKKKKI